MGHGSRPNQKILALAESNDPGCGKEFNFSLCRVRHMAAKLREARGMRHEYEPCAYCPKFLAPVEENTPATTPPEPQKPVEQYQITPEKPKEIKKMKPSLTCKKCGDEITKRIAAGSCTCKKCRQKQYQAAYLAKKNSDRTHPAQVKPKWESCVKCFAVTPEDKLEKTPDGLICPTCAGKFDKPAPVLGAKPICNETAPKVTQEKSNVTYEPATNTIYTSRPPEEAKLVIPIQEIDVCRRAINQYGILRQMAKAAEEFAEAAAAINRHIATEGSHEEIISELADVEVMCVQMRLIYGADAIDQVRAEKIARLHGRLK